MAKGIYQRKRLEERFWSKVDKTSGQGPKGDCWIWKAGCTTGGYGEIRIKGKTIRAPRCSWIMTNGPILNRLHVLHHCDNPPCVRPDHLFLGTDHDNHLDASKKGRLSFPRINLRGEKHGRNKLSEEEVLEIKKRLMSAKKLSKKYEVSIGAIEAIFYKRNWSWLTQAAIK